MLCMKKPSSRGFTEHRRRQNNILRRILWQMGQMELTVQLLKKHYGWAGHVARMPPGRIAAQWALGATLEAWRLQQAVGQAVDKQNRLRWRHAKKGPVTRWDSLLHRVLGPTWTTMAQDRDKWKASCKGFAQEACNLLFGVGHRMFGLTEGAAWGHYEGSGIAPSAS